MGNKILQITTEVLGVMTRLPDSQTIFGTLIWHFVRQGQAEFVKEIFQDPGIKIKVSNMMPQYFMPNVYSWEPKSKLALSFRTVQDQAAETTFLFGNTSYKAKKNSYKKRKWIAASSMVNSELVEDHSFRTMNNSAQIAEKKDGVFSQQHLNFMLVENDVQRKYTQFVFYIEIDEQYVGLLESLLEQQVLCLGNRSSRGMNLFEVLTIEEISMTSDGANRYLNLGMLGLNNAADIDMSTSNIKYHISDRCGYNDWEQRHVIKYIDVGSLITCTDVDKLTYYHRLSTERYLYTGGFLLPISEVSS